VGGGCLLGGWWGATDANTAICTHHTPHTSFALTQIAEQVCHGHGEVGCSVQGVWKAGGFVLGEETTRVPSDDDDDNDGRDSIDGCLGLLLPLEL